MIMQNPELLQMATSAVMSLKNGTGSGGARPNSGTEGNGATQAANVNKTNQRNAAETKRQSTQNQSQLSGGNK